MTVTIVDSKFSLIALLDSIENLPANPPSLYFDIEGVRLSRYGSISIVQLYVLPVNHVYLIDVHTLHRDAFYAVNSAGKSLKVILESNLVPKVFFDVRNDSDALFSHFQIRLRGICDVQLMEVATRSFSKQFLSGLAACIERDAVLTTEEKKAWKDTKQSGTVLFSPEYGGSYEVFNARPIPSEIISYCTQDVAVLPSLWSVYSHKLSSKWAQKVLVEASERVRISQSASYDPEGKLKSLSPWGKPPAKAKTTQQAKVPTRDSTLKDLHLRPAVEPGTDRLEEANPALSREPCTESSHLFSPPIRVKLPPSTGALSILQLTPSAANSKSYQNKIIGAGNQPIKTHDETPMAPVISPKQNRISPPSINNPSMYWICGPCSRKMLVSQKDAHLQGKPHIKNLLAQSTILTPNPTIDVVIPSKTPARKKKNSRSPALKASVGVSVPSKQTVPASKSAKPRTNFSACSSRLVATNPPPNYSLANEDFEFGSAFGINSLDDQNWGLCDKDCGWCGHCMDGVDVDGYDYDYD